MVFNIMEEETRIREIGKFVEEHPDRIGGVGCGTLGTWPHVLLLLHPRILSASFYIPAGHHFNSVFPSWDYLKKKAICDSLLFASPFTFIERRKKQQFASYNFLWLNIQLVYNEQKGYFYLKRKKKCWHVIH